jgi:hypothetical protein
VRAHQWYTESMKANNTEGFAWTGPFDLLTLDKRGMSASRLLKTKEGVVLGAAVAGLALQTLDDALITSTLNNAGELVVFIVDNGVLISSSVPKLNNTIAKNRGSTEPDRAATCVDPIVSFVASTIEEDKHGWTNACSDDTSRTSVPTLKIPGFGHYWYQCSALSDQFRILKWQLIVVEKVKCDQGTFISPLNGACADCPIGAKCLGA